MYDIIIIGAGPGGYIAAKEAGIKGKKVLLIERGELGGVCLNEGCIPTKTLLNSAKRYDHAVNSAGYGVHVDSAEFNINEAREWKEKVIKIQRKGIAFLMEQSRVDVIRGEACFENSKRVLVDGKPYEGQSVIIATGSSPLVPPIPGIDNPHVVTSSGMLDLSDIPEKIVVIGGGVIGIEFASFCHMIGREVHVIEMMPEILPFMEPELCRVMRRGMKGINFHLDCRVTEITPQQVICQKKGQSFTLEAGLVLAAAGRKPNIEGLELERAGVRSSKTGIFVNDLFQTSAPGVYAIGDVIGKSMFAHSASRMGEAVVSIIDGTIENIDFNFIPWSVYSSPEAAGCGYTEETAANEGFDVVTAQVSMRSNGRFLAEYGPAPGVCKVVADQKSRELLGVHLAGGICSEMIYGVSVILHSGLTIDEICKSVFPHPSVSEVLREALLSLPV